MSFKRIREGLNLLNALNKDTEKEIFKKRKMWTSEIDELTEKIEYLSQYKNYAEIEVEQKCFAFKALCDEEEGKENTTTISYVGKVEEITVKDGRLFVKTKDLLKCRMIGVAETEEEMKEVSIREGVEISIIDEEPLFAEYRFFTGDELKTNKLISKYKIYSEFKQTIELTIKQNHAYIQFVTADYVVSVRFGMPSTANALMIDKESKLDDVDRLLIGHGN